jgi:hypothetical protein
MCQNALKLAYMHLSFLKILRRLYSGLPLTGRERRGVGGKGKKGGQGGASYQHFLFFSF